MNILILITLIFIFFGVTFVASLFRQATVNETGIKISGNDIYRSLFYKYVDISDYIRYLYYTLICQYPTMTVSGSFMFREGDVVKYSAKDGGLREAQVLMIYNETIILKPMNDGRILR